MRTRISIVAPGVNRPEPVDLAGSGYRLWFEAVWQPSADTAGNLKVKVARAGQKSVYPPLLEADCWFGLGYLSVLGLREGSAGVSDFEAERLREWVEDNTEEFGSRVRALMLPPFKYEANLYGVPANDFFGPTGTRYSVRLAAIDGRYFLVAERR
jgi:hypothetical protein